MVNLEKDCLLDEIKTNKLSEKPYIIDIDWSGGSGKS